MRRARALVGGALIVGACSFTGVQVAGIGARPAAADAVAPVVDAKGSAPAPHQLTGTLHAPVVDMVSDPSGPGYWLVASDGGIFTSGHAHFWGSTGTLHLAQPIVAMAPTPTGRGYWLAAADGGVFAFGDANFKGSLGGLRLAAPIVAMAATPTGRGYWLVASDGGVFAFGDAQYRGGAAGAIRTSAIVDIAPTASGHGYVLLGGDGTPWSFGDAPTLPNATAHHSAVAIVRSATGGFWALQRDGVVHALAGAGYFGSAHHGNHRAIGIAGRNDGHGYWVAHVAPGAPAPPNSGSGRRIVYSVSAQRVWTVESNGTVSHFWKVSGHVGFPPPGTYAIVSRTPTSYSGSLRLPWMQRFYKSSAQAKWAGFHGIPLRPNGTPIQSDAQLGTPLSHGCVRMNQTDVKTLWDWAPLGTTVVVLR